MVWKTVSDCQKVVCVQHSSKLLHEGVWELLNGGLSMHCNMYLIPKNKVAGLVSCQESCICQVACPLCIIKIMSGFEAGKQNRQL